MTRPNILFLFSDEHSFRFMGHVSEEDGGEPIDTPAFDRLAEDGALFTDAYCQMPLCTPSRLCMLSGREARRCGAWTNDSVLRPELPTLPGVLRDAGYTTCLVGKMHLGGSQQYVGFEHRPYGDLTGKTGHQWEPVPEPAKGMRSRTKDAVGVTHIPESLLQEAVIAEETVAFLREHRSADPDKPWFLCASFSRPHFPLTAPKRHLDKFWPSGVTEPKVPATGDAYDHPMSAGMRKGFLGDEIPHEETMYARACYFACVSYLDEVIGDLLVRLERDGLLDNTIIVYSSDHGEMAGEHGVWWKNGWYEACTRIPLIVSLPEHRTDELPGTICRTPVRLIDLFPTLCGLAGVDAPGGLDGQDLSAAVRGEDEAPDVPVFCDSLSPRWGDGTEFRMIRQEKYKVVHFRNGPPLAFDLEADPGEQTNLLQSKGEIPEKVRQLLRLAEESMDFNEAERERTERDGNLHQEYPLKVSEHYGNVYTMPSGRLVYAEDPIYRPTVIAESAGDLFGRDWREQNKTKAAD